MKKSIITALLFATAAVVTPSVKAEIPVSRVEQYSPTDMVFLDMATEAAKENQSRGQQPNGAVIVVNGEFRSSGRSTASSSAEETAFKKSRLSTLKGATLYTVNEPTAAIYKFLCENGIDKIYFVNGKDAVIKAGIATSADYNSSSLPSSLTFAPMFQIEFPDAALLLK